MLSADLDTTVVWVHGDALSPQNPALLAYPGVPALFVFDDALLRRWEISLKRIVFIYECLLEMPVTIRRGDVVAEVTAFAREHGAGRVATVHSPSPDFPVLARAISQGLPKGGRVEAMHPDPFVDYDGHIDLKRFSRYWRTVKDYAFG